MHAAPLPVGDRLGRRGTFASPAGARIAVEAAIGDLDPPGIVLVTDLAVDLRSDPRGRWPVQSRWVRERYAGGAVVCSICTGSVFLAVAGLLDAAVATTHWAAVPIFRDHFPSVRLEPSRILCPTGPEHRIVTAGGASSWTDLALYLIARFCGETEARRIAKVFLIGDRSAGQMPFAAMARPR
jgi:transcriptional regulator GlxA family with amidase domain